MNISHRIIVVSMLSLLLVSTSGMCLEEKASQPDKKKNQADFNRSLEENKKQLTFYKQRNVAAGKMLMGMSSDIIDQASPSGVKLGTLKPSTGAEEFFISIDKTGYYADQVNMNEGMLPRKKTK